ncbi:MAG: hypothetical protein U9N46_11930 [Euryarchaeota archaeon]|nr:MAG: hypothetical protein C5S48_06350 [ANME-2 cluster archaeon]MEA1865872.1 hypothetical protein [Euryarchaeota archaeon]
METRTRAGVVALGILSLIVLSTLTLALAAPETDGGTNRVTCWTGEEAGPDAEDLPRYRADARHSEYTASQLPSDLSLVRKWEGKAPSGPIVIPISRTCDVW